MTGRSNNDIPTVSGTVGIVITKPCSDADSIGSARKGRVGAILSFIELYETRDLLCFLEASTIQGAFAYTVESNDGYRGQDSDHDDDNQ